MPNNFLTLKFSDHSFFLPLCILLLGFALFGNVIYSPALVFMMHDLHLSSHHIGLFNGTYLFAYAIGQLCCGQLAFYFGKFKTLFLGLWIVIFSNGLALYGGTHLNWTLLFYSHIFAGLGAACGSCIATMLARMNYQEKTAQMIFSKAWISFALIPAAGNFLGAFMLSHFNWAYLPILWIAYAIMIAFFAFISKNRIFQNQTTPVFQPYSFKHLLINYKEFSYNPIYLKFILLFALGGSTNYLFSAVSPLAAIVYFGISPKQFANFFLFPSFGIIFASLFFPVLIRRFSNKLNLYLSIWLIFFASVFLWQIFYFHLPSIFIFVAGFILFSGSNSLMPQAAMLALSHVKDQANGASALHAFSLSLAAFNVYVCTTYLSHSVFIFPFAFTGIALIGLIVLKSLAFQK